MNMQKITFSSRGYICLIVLSFLCFNSFAQVKDQSILLQAGLSEDSLVSNLTKTLIDYNSYLPVEKIYLHTDKDLFTPGEDIWYSSYSTLGNNQKYLESTKLLYVEFISPEGKILVLNEQQLENGRGSGVIEIPENLPSGSYIIRSYTDWMRNFDTAFFYTKKVKIVSDKASVANEKIIDATKIDLQFFPEGGDAIVGLNTKIAFKAIGADGKGVDVKGKIVNAQGEIITPISSIDKGSGFFYLKPTLREHYTAVLDNGNAYKLPLAKSQGYLLNINNSNLDSLQINVSASPKLRTGSFYIIGHLNNQKYFQGKFNLKGKKSILFDIPKKLFPRGVITFTLFNEEMKPLNERVVFINKQEELKITAKMFRAALNARNKIVMDIDVTDQDGKPVATDLSIAVTDIDKVFKNETSSNILTYLLLQSDLKGDIENPGQYFKVNNRDAQSRLDLVMLTNGWRRIKWEEIANGDYKKPQEYTFLRGIQLSGKAKENRRKPLSNSSLTILSRNSEGEKVYYAETGIDGSFSVANIQQSDSLELEFVAYNKRGRPIDVLVELNPKELNNYGLKANYKWVKKPKEAPKSKIYLETAQLKRAADSIYNSGKVTKLKEVVVEEDRLNDEKKKSILESRPSEFGITPDRVFYFDSDKPTNLSLSDVLGNFAGIQAVTVINPVTLVPELRIRARGLGERDVPFFRLDGIPIQAQDLLDLGLLNPSASINIERVEYIQGSRAASFGARADTGVILIYTRKGGQAVSTNNATTSRHKISGYTISKEFYAPKYNIKKPEHVKPDYRTTLYWNPNVRTDENGKATISFYNSDIAKQLQVDVQGLSENALPGAFLGTFGTSANNK